jgi:hypothetical protein
MLEKRSAPVLGGVDLTSQDVKLIDQLPKGDRSVFVSLDDAGGKSELSAVSQLLVSHQGMLR